MKVLIIEDEASLAEELEHFLKKEKYFIDLARNGKQASELLYVNKYDFVLLDLGLPDYDGLDLLLEAKEEINSEAAFIILTARDSVEDKIKGLNLGADDYLPKPFSLLELHSRMKAILRRKFGTASNIVRFGEFTLDISNRLCKFNDKEINLTKKEFDLLNYLVLHKNRVLTRMQLSEHIWGNLLEDDFDSNYIDVHIKNLRRKLSTYSDQEWLETVRGIGYRFKTNS